jgi:hypothetical protein
VVVVSGRDARKAEQAAAPKPLRLARGDLPGPPLLMWELETRGRSRAGYRAWLREQAARGRVPEALDVDLALWLHNPGPRALLLDLADPATSLWLDLSGPAVVRVPAVGRGRALARLGRVTLAPNAGLLVPLERLADRTAHWYWTEPGRYRLSAQIRARAAELNPAGPGPWRERNFTTPPVLIDVTAD